MDQCVPVTRREGGRKEEDGELESKRKTGGSKAKHREAGMVCSILSSVRGQVSTANWEPSR